MTTGKTVVKSSEGVAAVLEILDVVELSSVSMVLGGTGLSVGNAVLSGESTMVLALPAVDSVNPAPRDEGSADDGDVIPTVVPSTAPLSRYGVDVVTFGSPTTAVKAGDSTTGVEVGAMGEDVSITGISLGEAVLSRASVDSLLEMMFDEGLLVMGLDTAEMGI